MKRTLLLASAILLLSGAMAHGKDYESQRPAPEKRLFRSEAVESKITQMQGILTNPRLAWMFANCYPNTLTPQSTSARTKTVTSGHSSTPATSTPCG